MANATAERDWDEPKREWKMTRSPLAERRCYLCLQCLRTLPDSPKTAILTCLQVSLVLRPLLCQCLSLCLLCIEYRSRAGGLPGPPGGGR
eukprot:g2170.t1